MNRQAKPATIVFGALLAITLGGIALHQLTGYSYPVTQASSFELNVLGDIYEAFIAVPAGALAVWGMRRGAAWAPVLATAVTVHFAYNYTMAVSGRQNLWIFLWVAKASLALITMCLLWPLLPTGRGLSRRSRLIVTAYLLLVAVAFTGLMGKRLLASATGSAVDMTMQQNGAIDWGDPVLRDPIVFLAAALPLMVAGVLGFPGGTGWGGKAATASCAFGASMVSVVLFTGPLKELLQGGSISPAMLGMSAVMLMAGGPAALFLRWIVRDSRHAGEA